MVPVLGALSITVSQSRQVRKEKRKPPISPTPEKKKKKRKKKKRRQIQTDKQRINGQTDGQRIDGRGWHGHLHVSKRLMLRVSPTHAFEDRMKLYNWSYKAKRNVRTETQNLGLGKCLLINLDSFACCTERNKLNAGDRNKIYVTMAQCSLVTRWRSPNLGKVRVAART